PLRALRHDDQRQRERGPDRPDAQAAPVDRRRLLMKLVVNGKPVEVAVPPETPLLWALREEVGLTGTKFGCGAALCGACTVHIDGAPTRSCSVTLSAVAGKSVTTIEGLASGGADHAVQQAWAELNVPQCGYCQ